MKANHWLRQLQHEMAASHVDEIPKGFKSCEQLAAESGLNVSAVRRLVRLAGDKMESRRLRVAVNNKILKMRFYRKK